MKRIATEEALDPAALTRAYYEKHAEAYCRQTVGLDLAELYRPFLSLVPPGGHILDAGCGSGRDSLVFQRAGYQFTAFDASPCMAAAATALLQAPVLTLDFAAVPWVETFDGVWACASLLHLPRAELEGAVGNLSRALKPGGVLYISFKRGAEEGFLDGRWFTDFEAEPLRKLLARQPQLELASLWQTADLRGTNRGWCNALLRRER